MNRKTASFLPTTVSLLTLFCGAALCQTAAAGNATDSATKTDAPLITSLTSEPLQKLVQAMGFECTRRTAVVFTFRAEGFTVGAEDKDGSSILLSMGLSGYKTTLATVNKWNQEHRFSRAYLDKEGDAILENDHMIRGGITRESVELFVTLFRESVVEFARFVSDHEGHGTKP